MQLARSGMLLVPLFLALGSCASLQVAPVRLDEPNLPACLVEQAPKAGEAVGRLEFEPAWLGATVALSRQGQTAEAVKRALECASATAKALREAVTAIKLNNRSQ